VRLPSFVKLLACALVAGVPSLSAQVSTAPLHYIPLPIPCRATDTRVQGGGGPIAGGTIRNFDPSVNCSIPLPSDGVIAYAVNVTAVPHGPLGYITVFPDGGTLPTASTLNSYNGVVKANAAIVSGGYGGAISVFASNTTDLVIDVSGYFTSDDASYVYVPITPCRVVDTRINNGTPFGAPSLGSGQQRSFSLANSPCNIPSGALADGGALSLNVTAIPLGGGIGYLTAWGTSPSSPGPPITSTLNAPSADPVANAAIVTMDESTSDSVSVYTSDATNIAIDITGYFASMRIAPGGLSLYETTPCRVLDTRLTTGVFQGERTVPFTTGNACSVPTNAEAYVTNATVVPSGPLGYLTLWPDGSPVPTVSTLNAYDGSVTSNMAIVTTTNGSIDAYAYNPTQLILDISGYFALSPAASLPSVVFIGDDVTSQWATNSNAFQLNPNWINKGVPGQNSGQILARFPTDVVDLHPSIVNIITGSYDVSTTGWVAECGDGGIPAIETCANIASMVALAKAAGIKVIVGTIPPYGSDNSSTPYANSLLFNRGLIQDVTVPGASSTIFTGDTTLVDYGSVSTFLQGPPVSVGGFTAMTTLAEDMVNLYPVTLKSGFLGNPGSVNTVAPGTTVPFTAYGVYSDGSTRALNQYIYYEGPPSFSSSNSEVMEIDATTGIATASQAGTAIIKVTAGGITFSQWNMTVN
jgi:hypothetical protein